MSLNSTELGHSAPAPSGARYSMPLSVEPTDPNALTARELEVLALAGRAFSVKGIGRELGVASGTVKWHLKNIYGKLDVGCREAALIKARARYLVP